MLSHRLLMTPRASQANERLLPASRPLPDPAKLEPNRSTQRRGGIRVRAALGWQAEACPTKAVRASLGWTGQEAYPTTLRCRIDELRGGFRRETQNSAEEICFRVG
jgi:hypothetical protein